MFSRFLLDLVQLDQAAVIKQLSGLEVFSGPKIHTRPEHDVHKYIYIFFFNDKPDPRQTRLNYTWVRPDRIYFRTRLDPNVNSIGVCTACRLLPDLAAASLLSFSLFTY